MSKELQRLMDEVSDWQHRTFGKHNSAIGKSYHLQRESKELTDAMIKHEQLGTIETYNELKEEFSDCIILIIGSAKIYGIDASGLLENSFKKLEKCKKRTWSKPDENGVCQHIEL